MEQNSVKKDDPLSDFNRRVIELDGVAKDVLTAGTGPAVVVMVRFLLRRRAEKFSKEPA